MAVILDTQVPKDDPGPRAECFEQAVSLAAAAGEYLARQEYIVDIFAAGPHLYHLVAGRSLAYLDQILDILACVESTQAEPFEILAPELSAHLAQISAVVCIFLDWNDTRRQFVRHLQEHGVGVKVIVVSEDVKSAGEHRIVSARAVEAGLGEL